MMLGRIGRGMAAVRNRRAGSQDESRRSEQQHSHETMDWMRPEHCCENGFHPYSCQSALHFFTRGHMRIDSVATPRHVMPPLYLRLLAMAALSFISRCTQ